MFRISLVALHYVLQPFLVLFITLLDEQHIRSKHSGLLPYLPMLNLNEGCITLCTAYIFVRHPFLGMLILHGLPFTKTNFLWNQYIGLHFQALIKSIYVYSNATFTSSCSYNMEFNCSLKQSFYSMHWNGSLLGLGSLPVVFLKWIGQMELMVPVTPN